MWKLKKILLETLPKPIYTHDNFKKNEKEKK